ncbi:hypothetical protein KSS87_023369, partial [Heliosperma pusillum]
MASYIFHIITFLIVAISMCEATLMPLLAMAAARKHMMLHGRAHGGGHAAFGFHGGMNGGAQGRFSGQGSGGGQAFG